MTDNTLKKPGWIKGRISAGPGHLVCEDILSGYRLNSVCEEAACPNKGECWERRHVTFLILGNICARSCKFCNISNGNILTPDEDEPVNVAMAVSKLAPEYVVITSVTRDDLADKGLEQFRKTVFRIRELCPGILIELLIPDMTGDIFLLEEISELPVNVIGHNMEMPERLYEGIRPGASYQRSLEVLNALAVNTRYKKEVFIKSSIILGLGETKDEIVSLLRDIRSSGTDIVYIGQYLSPTKDHWPVAKYYTPEEFREIGDYAREIGFHSVFSGPMIRSSYRGKDSFLEALNAVRCTS